MPNSRITVSRTHFVQILLFLLSFSIERKCLAGDTLLKTACSNITYAPNSTYETNLNVLMSSLVANATLSMGKVRFFNATVVGQPGGFDTIYGLFLCRGDDSKSDCRTCVPAASKRVFQECPGRPVSATIWYVDCMVRYSNESIFGIMDHSISPPLFMRTTHENMTTNNVDDFMQLVGQVMQNVATCTSNSATKYAVMEANFTSFLTVYAQAQCTPDLSIDECQACLTVVNNYYPECCSASKGALVLTPSCYSRYEIYRFYQVTPRSIVNILATPTINSQGETNYAGKKRVKYIVIGVLVPFIVVMLVLATICVYLRRKKRRRHMRANNGIGTKIQHTLTDIPSFDFLVDGELLNAESLQYDLTTLQMATNNFCVAQKVGEGGFGGVYMGVLPDGKEIAVKRLSSSSDQGLQQFVNEVVFVAKLQHKNLVRLLGYSMAQFEKLLVYEYVPNKSLDQFLFEPSKQGQLDWPTRYKIIKGIARGMLYLHEDSRLKIIHRDLKASNILLDANMNPKISDFGTARCFNVDESQANTSRIAGTFGYMAPEYVLHGEFSAKSDVYSFGVLILEIVTGRRSTSLRQTTVDEHLLTYVWKQWIEDKPLEVVDQSFGESYTHKEALRCIHVGLLCVQGDPKSRPTMASVVLNLDSSSENTLPEPQQPGFFMYNKMCSNLQVII